MRWNWDAWPCRVINLHLSRRLRPGAAACTVGMGIGTSMDGWGRHSGVDMGVSVAGVASAANWVLPRAQSA